MVDLWLEPRLLSGDIDINRLGLLIVDEEYRFGVKHKEEMAVDQKQG